VRGELLMLHLQRPRVEEQEHKQTGTRVIGVYSALNNTNYLQPAPSCYLRIEGGGGEQCQRSLPIPKHRFAIRGVRILFPKSCCVVGVFPLPAAKRGRELTRCRVC